VLAIARERSPKGDFHIGDLEASPFDDAAFDAVTRFSKSASLPHRQRVNPKDWMSDFGEHVAGQEGPD
jgi:hypothetical protein